MTDQPHEAEPGEESTAHFSTFEILGVPDEEATDGERWLAEEVVKLRALGDKLYIEPPGGYREFSEAELREREEKHEAVLRMLEERMSAHARSKAGTGTDRERG